MFALSNLDYGNICAQQQHTLPKLLIIDCFIKNIQSIPVGRVGKMTTHIDSVQI